MKSTHTAGPWIVAPPSGTGEPDSRKQFDGYPYREHSLVLAAIGDHQKAVAHVYQGIGGVGSPNALEEQHNNARLIAAAPDLLSAAQNTLDKLEARTDPHNVFQRDRDELRAAIAKATGKDSHDAKTI